MTREDIIRMAQEAGLDPKADWQGVFIVTTGFVERFAHLVAAAENRACAQIADASEPYKAMDLIMSRWKA